MITSLSRSQNAMLQTQLLYPIAVYDVLLYMENMLINWSVKTFSLSIVYLCRWWGDVKAVVIGQMGTMKTGIGLRQHTRQHTIS